MKSILNLIMEDVFTDSVEPVQFKSTFLVEADIY